jgi:hypothetical protein
MDLQRSDGRIETLSMLKDEWIRLLTNMILALAQSGDKNGMALLKWCQENIRPE